MVDAGNWSISYFDRCPRGKGLKYLNEPQKRSGGGGPAGNQNPGHTSDLRRCANETDIYIKELAIPHFRCQRLKLQSKLCAPYNQLVHFVSKTKCVY
jgi:hypothetical protein